MRGFGGQGLGLRGQGVGFNERGSSVLTTSGKRPEPVEMRDFRTVDFEVVVGSKFRALRDQVGTSQGFKVNCVMQVDS